VGTRYAIEEIAQARIKSIERRFACTGWLLEFEQRSLRTTATGKLKLLRSGPDKAEKRVLVSRQPPENFLAEPHCFRTVRKWIAGAKVQAKQSAGVRTLLQDSQRRRIDYEKRTVGLNRSRNANGFCGTSLKIAVIQSGHRVMPS
jgi:hypothetical protein